MKRLRHLRVWKAILFILSVALSYGPMLVLTIYGFVQSSNSQRVGLGFVVVLSLILLFIQWKCKHRCRSILWLILLMLYLILDSITAGLIAITVCTVIDELIVEPLYTMVKGKYNRVLQAKEVWDYKE